MTTLLRLSPATDRPVRDPNYPRFLVDASFETKEAEERFGSAPLLNDREIEQSFMPDDVTRDLSARMHYAGFRVSGARRQNEADRWRARYYDLRDKIVLGNRKLIYRAVRRSMAMSNRADDLIGDCQIVLIQAVAAYNPWLGIRFSTYAYTCLVRALSRLSQRMASDWLTRSLPLDSLAGAEPGNEADPCDAAATTRVDEFLRDDHPLLTPREKMILRLRFSLSDRPTGATLERVGKAVGLSKERVRQVQKSAIGKLRLALLGDTENSAPE